jgi:ubiquinone/menaquinone biosynthesis C-methylase UbiE
VSSLAIHNIRGRLDRAKAVAEAWRVLKPGGRLLIADIRSTALYAKTLETLGAVTTTRRLGWRFWYGNPFAATTRRRSRRHEGDPFYFFSSARAAARMLRRP